MKRFHSLAALAVSLLGVSTLSSCGKDANAEVGPVTFGTASPSGEYSAFPDFVSVTDDAGKIVGYIDKHFLFNAPSPTSPESAAKQHEDLVFPVVNKDMKVVAYVGANGLLTTAETAGKKIADIQDYMKAPIPPETVPSG